MLAGLEFVGEAKKLDADFHGARSRHFKERHPLLVPITSGSLRRRNAGLTGGIWTIPSDLAMVCLIHPGVRQDRYHIRARWLFPIPTPLDRRCHSGSR